MNLEEFARLVGIDLSRLHIAHSLDEVITIASECAEKDIREALARVKNL